MDEVDSKRSDVLIAGARAATVLEHLLKNGAVPAHHVSQIREIVDGYNNARALWHRAIGIPTEVARA